MDKVVILGAGGHAKVIADILLQNNEYEIVGLVDSRIEQTFMGLRVIGDDECLKHLYKQGVKKAFVAIGSNQLRRKLSVMLETIGFERINVISGHAVISPTACLGSGIAVMPGAVINACASIGNGCIINTNASVDHDVFIKEYTHIAPGNAIAGCVSIGECCFIGIGCRIIDNIIIGNNVTLGAGAVVLNDIEDDHLAVGIPAKIKR